MKLRTTKQPPKPRNTRKPETPEQRFEREWARVQTLHQEVQSLDAELEAFTARVVAAISEHERALADALFQQTRHLLSFFSRKSLSQWQRETLAEWLVENLELLRNQPFNDHLDVTALTNQIRGVFESYYGARTQGEDDEGEDLQTDVFEDEDDRDEPVYGDEEAANEREFFERLFQEFSEKQEQAEAEHRAERKSLDQLLKTSSINKLFRRIARVLHPDREQDIEQQKIKHEKMSELIHARDHGDVLKIFSLYSEHVGESPLALIDTDLDKVTQLLRQQTRRLLEEKEDLIYSDPLRAAIYRNFHANTDRGIERNIREHLGNLIRQSRQEREATRNITSLKTLKPYLEQRYDAKEMAEWALSSRPGREDDYY